MTAFTALARLAVVLGGALALEACGATETAPKPTDTSGSVAVDGDRAFSVTFDVGRPCDESACGAVRSFDRATGASTVLARVAGIGSYLAVDEDSVYFTSTTGSVFSEGGQTDTTNAVTTIARVPKVGGPTTVVAALPHAAVTGLVVRGGSVFFTVYGVDTNGGTPSLWSVPKAGGAIAVLATTTPDESGVVTQVVADDAFVYWAMRSYSGGNDTFVIRRTPFAGETQPTIFARGDSWLVGMALDATGLYATKHGPNPTGVGNFDATGGSVIAISFAGTQRTLASGIRNVGAVAAFGSRVAWASWESDAPNPSSPNGEVRAMAKTGGDQTSLLVPFVAGSLSADSGGVCATALYAASVVCVKD